MTFATKFLKDSWDDPGCHIMIFLDALITGPWIEVVAGAGSSTGSGAGHIERILRTLARQFLELACQISSALVVEAWACLLVPCPLCAT